jgi:hypothetical protein
MSGVRCFNGINGATGEYGLAPRSTSNDLRLSWTTDPMMKAIQTLMTPACYYGSHTNGWERGLVQLH